MAVDLTTLQRVKDLHGSISGTTRDTILARLISQVSRQFESWLDCAFLKTARTELFYIADGQTRFRLKAFPVDSSAAFTVKNAYDGDFTSASAIPTSDYAVDYARGILTFRSTYYSLVAGPQSLQVVYTGGIGVDATAVVAATDYSDLSFACEQQVLHDLQRTPNFGSPSRSVGGGGQNFDSGKDSPFTPDVTIMLDQYMRR